MKGVLFSIGLLVLSMTILTTSFIFLQGNIESQEEIARLSIYDRMHSEIKCIENSYSNILSMVVDVSIYDNSVSFRERLPNPNADDFKDNVDGFREFAINNSDFYLQLDMTEVKNDLPLIVEPLGIKYYHDSGFGNNRIAVINSSDIANYSLDLKIAEDGSINTVWNDVAGTDEFSINIETNTDTYSETRSLDFSASSTLEINISDATDKFINMVIGDLDIGSLEIENTDNLDLIVYTEMGVESDIPSVTFPKETINMTAVEYKISKLGKIRVM